MSSFKTLNKEEFSAMSENKETKFIKKWEAIFSEGEHLNGVFGVRQGILKLS